MLARAGVGQLTIIDRDFVEESNLQRQSLFSEADARQGLPKAVAAQRALRAVNSEVRVEGIIKDVTWENIDNLCRNTDLIVDGTDNFETRFLINDFAVKYGPAVGLWGLCRQLRRGIRFFDRPTRPASNVSSNSPPNRARLRLATPPASWRPSYMSSPPSRCRRP